MSAIATVAFVHVVRDHSTGESLSVQRRVVLEERGEGVLSTRVQTWMVGGALWVDSPGVVPDDVLCMALSRALLVEAHHSADGRVAFDVGPVVVVVGEPR